jgi:uncharacterized protein (TIGR03086 family)
MADSPVDQLARAHDVTGALIAGVRADQWGAPTPCTEWTVVDLVHHLVAGNVVFERALRGDPIDPAELARTGPDPERLPSAYRESSDALLAAFAVPGALERVVTVPFGAVPGAVALHLRMVEALVHGWDLARATAQPVNFADDVAEQELQFTLAKLGDIPPERSPFHARQPVSDDAPAIERLAACLGRRPG